MMKYKNGIVSEVKRKREFQENQELLREKYNLQSGLEKIVVVEKSNMAKFTVKTMSALIRILATIAILILAAIGLLVLAYPETREVLLYTLKNLIPQIKNML